MSRGQAAPLKPRAYSVRIVLTDAPSDGEAYIATDELKDMVLRGHFEAGVSMEITDFHLVPEELK